MKNNRILISIFFLLIISLACNLPATASKTQIPQTNVDPQEILDQAVKVDPASKSITVILTEDQMNTILLNQINKVEMPSGASLKNPSVKLQNGLITFMAQLESGLLTFDIKISLKPVKNSDNQWSFEMVEADFGPLPVPDEMKQQFSGQINDAVTQAISQSGEAITIDDISIADGKMVVTAHR